MVLQNEFHHAMQTSTTQNDFELMGRLVGDRVQRPKLQLLHKSSRITCYLQFDRDVTLADSSQKVRDYISYAPICE